MLGIFGDSVTTDHICPAGAIKPTSPAGKYLHRARRARGRLQQLRRAPRQPRGDDARHLRQRAHQEPDAAGEPTAARRRRRDDPCSPTGEQMPIYDAAMAYSRAARRPIVFAGEEYGTGCSRDWAAKGTQLLGVKAVVARSFERIHRSNLVGMGVLPLPVQGQRQRGLAAAQRRRDVRHRPASSRASGRSRT